MIERILLYDADVLVTVTKQRQEIRHGAILTETGIRVDLGVNFSDSNDGNHLLGEARRALRRVGLA